MDIWGCHTRRQHRPIMSRGQAGRTQSVQVSKTRPCLHLVSLSYCLLTQLGATTLTTSPSFSPSFCCNPQAHWAASIRRPPYVKVLSETVSAWISLSFGTLSGLYLDINCGIVMLSSVVPSGQNDETMIFESAIARCDWGFGDIAQPTASAASPRRQQSNPIPLGD